MSEACRPLLKNKVDGPLGNAIDIFAILGLLFGTATTFSLATPMMAEALGTAFGFQAGKGLTIAILLFIGLLFTVTVMAGMKAVNKLSVLCVVLFAALALYVFLAGPTAFILESGISGIGAMAQNFLQMATWTDPMRLTGDGTLGFGIGLSWGACQLRLENMLCIPPQVYGGKPCPQQTPQQSPQQTPL